MVAMGRVTAPFGVKGWVKIHALTAAPRNLCNYPAWWLQVNGEWRETKVEAARVHGAAVIAQFAGVDDRDAAARLKGVEVAVPRAQLPAAASGEYYWADLIGLSVVNQQREQLGRVARVLQTGANDVLVVSDEAAGATEVLVPFIADAIRRVDVAAGVIEVDWGRDY